MFIRSSSVDSAILNQSGKFVTRWFDWPGEMCLKSSLAPGVNFVHYDSAPTTRIYALEPNPGMIRLAEHQLEKTKLNIQFIDLANERVPLESGSVDTILIVNAIREMKRVVKPGGKLIFFEHGLSPDPRVQCWHRRLEPFFGCAFEGCHLTRNIPSLIRNGDFSIEQMEEGYLVPFPKSPLY